MLLLHKTSIAAPAVAANAYLSIAYNGVPTFDLYVKFLMYFALAMYASLAYTGARSFLGQCCFSIAEW